MVTRFYFPFYTSCKSHEKSGRLMSIIIDYNFFLPVTIDENHGTRNESSHRSTEVFRESAFVCPCPCTESYGGSKGIAPFILNLSAMWRWVVSITSRPLCPEKEQRCHLNRKVNRPQSQSERWRKEGDLLSLLVFELRIVQPVTKFFLSHLNKVPHRF
jgi:hypothetical protein